jgi:hypothetical protein
VFAWLLPTIAALLSASSAARPWPGISFGARGRARQHEHWRCQCADIFLSTRHRSVQKRAGCVSQTVPKDTLLGAIVSRCRVQSVPAIFHELGACSGASLVALGGGAGEVLLPPLCKTNVSGMTIKQTSQLAEKDAAGEYVAPSTSESVVRAKVGPVPLILAVRWSGGKVKRALPRVWRKDPHRSNRNLASTSSNNAPSACPGNRARHFLHLVPFVCASMHHPR